MYRRTISSGSDSSGGDPRGPPPGRHNLGRGSPVPPSRGGGPGPGRYDRGDGGGRGGPSPVRPGPGGHDDYYGPPRGGDPRDRGGGGGGGGPGGPGGGGPPGPRGRPPSDEQYAPPGGPAPRGRPPSDDQYGPPGGPGPRGRPPSDDQYAPPGGPGPRGRPGDDQYAPPGGPGPRGRPPSDEQYSPPGGPGPRGRPGDDYSPPDRRGGPPLPQNGRNQGPPPSAAAAGREIPRGSQTSETLSMAEQDFLAKYGYGGNNSMSSLPGPQSVVGAQSVTSADTGYSSISRPRMPRMGPGGVGGLGPGPGPPINDRRDHPHDRYVGSGQSVTSHMTESVISNPRMARMDMEEMELQRTQQSRGGGPARSRSPPPHQRPPDNRRYQDRVQNYNNPPNRPTTPSRDYPPERGGGFPRPNSRRNLYDDNSYEDPRGAPRGMDDPTPRRMMLQRMPSQSTISTSGFRSFYSDNYTVRDGASVSTGYQHYYEGPPPPPPRDDYHSSPQQRYGGAGVNTRPSAYGGGGGYGGGSVTSNSRGPPGGGGGGYYGGPPGPPRRGPTPPPPRDYSPRRQHQPPPPQRGPSQPDRPLLEVAPGLLMHLMGTDETMKAIQRGQITVTSCVVCGMDVHCHSASEYVLCPDCRVVSPVNQLDNAADMAPQQGGLVGLGVKTEMLITMMEAGGQQY